MLCMNECSIKFKVFKQFEQTCGKRIVIILYVPSVGFTNEDASKLWWMLRSKEAVL